MVVLTVAMIVIAISMVMGIVVMRFMVVTRVLMV